MACFGIADEDQAAAMFRAQKNPPKDRELARVGVLRFIDQRNVVTVGEARGQTGGLFRAFRAGAMQCVMQRVDQAVLGNQPALRHHDRELGQTLGGEVLLPGPLQAIGELTEFVQGAEPRMVET